MKEPVLFPPPLKGDYFRDSVGQWRRIIEVKRALQDGRGWCVIYDHHSWETPAFIDIHSDGQWHELHEMAI